MMNVVKIRGLNYTARYEEVSEFFKDYKIVPQSVVLGVNFEGRKNGFGAILFEDENEAKNAAAALNKQYIKDRYVDLSVISYEDYLNFNNHSSRGGSKTNYTQGSYVKISQCVNNDNVERALILRGLPYRISVEQVQTFLKDFGSIPEDQIFIEEFNGKRTGSALVAFESKETAQSAKNALQKTEMEGRYIELFDQEDEFFKKIAFKTNQF